MTLPPRFMGLTARDVAARDPRRLGVGAAASGRYRHAKAPPCRRGSVCQPSVGRCSGHCSSQCQPGGRNSTRGFGASRAPIHGTTDEFGAARGGFVLWSVAVLASTSTFPVGHDAHPRPPDFPPPRRRLACTPQAAHHYLNEYQDPKTALM